MTKRMLIDAMHSEETRVIVTENNQLLDFEYESALRKQLRGNIFLAKVTRVEPSLQAAFVNYGGNRHGFLPFSEIHPDYYRIPIADREALIEEQRAALEAARHAEEEEDAELEAMASRAEKKENPKNRKKKQSSKDEVSSDNIESLEDDTRDEDPAEIGGGAEVDAEDELEEDEDEDDSEESSEDENDENEESGDKDKENNQVRGKRFSRGQGRGGKGRYRRGGGGRGRNMPYRNDRVEMMGGDSIEGDRPIRPNLTRRYKIQEVIKRGQIMLVQVSKEERGQKGAAVTSYLSLPGRYCVLMPNSPRSGGVSRKIANFQDRKRLRDILKEFNLPDGMSVIVRTAGVARTKTEIKRDLDYLLRLWDNIRTTTLGSEAPALIYEEGDLVKRAIRDIYDREMDEVVVEGERAYKTARDIMKMMIPSHVKRVKEYKDQQLSLLHKYKLEEQISSIGEPTVPLKSGGSLVIHPTEALVSIDVNSGRATKERHIEETALRTNLEAAEAVARQLRLRDLGGLVVIDFIDMEDRRNNGKVERKLKEALSSDRARLQVGRISSFGLLELSRQRISASVTETQFQRCEHCEGTGFTRTMDSMAIVVLRQLETLGIEKQAAHVSVAMRSDVALYVLNQKRHRITDIEQRYDMKIFIHAEDHAAPAYLEIEVLKTRKDLAREQAAEEEDLVQETNADSSADEEEAQDNDKGNRRGGRGRRDRGGNNNRHRNARNTESSQDAQDEAAPSSQQESASEDNAPQQKPSPKKGQRRSSKAETAEVVEIDAKQEKPKRRRSSIKKNEATSEEGDSSAKTKQTEPADKAKKQGERPAAKKQSEETSIDQSAASNDDKNASRKPAAKEIDVQIHARAAEVVNEAPKKKKSGWWKRSSD